MRRPDASEYEQYYETYIGKVPGEDVLEILSAGAGLTAQALAGLAADWERYRYEPGKWSLREVLGHVVDVERVFSYRALSFARSDPAALPSMD